MCWKGGEPLSEKVVVVVAGQSWIGITLLTVVRCVVLWTGEESSFLARWPRLVILASWIMVITTGFLLIYSSWGTLEHTGTDAVISKWTGQLIRVILQESSAPFLRLESFRRRWQGEKVFENSSISLAFTHCHSLHAHHGLLLSHVRENSTVSQVNPELWEQQSRIHHLASQRSAILQNDFPRRWDGFRVLCVFHCNRLNPVGLLDIQYWLLMLHCSIGVPPKPEIIHYSSLTLRPWSLKDGA